MGTHFITAIPTLQTPVAAAKVSRLLPLTEDTAIQQFTNMNHPVSDPLLIVLRFLQ
jgi:hypothetical protein